MNTRIKKMLFGACAFNLVVASTSLVAAESHFPNNEDLRHVRAMSAPQLSPDGRRVLLQVMDTTTDGGRSHLWLVDIASDTFRQITWSPADDKRGERGARWMPDGENILFLAKRGEHTQLYRLPMAGGEAHAFDLTTAPAVDASKEPSALPPNEAVAASGKVEPLPLDVESYEISPDGRSIAVLARDPETPGEKKQKDEKADAVWLDHDLHGKRAYLLDLDSEKLTAVAVAPDVDSIHWDSQSDRFVAITEKPNDASDLGPADSAWLVSVKDPAHPTQLKQLPATAYNGAFSADGKRFYFMAQAEQDASPGYSDLYVTDLNGGPVHNLTADTTGSIGGDDLILAGDDVLESLQVGTRQTYMRLHADKPETLNFGTSVVAQLSSNARYTGWVWLGTSGTQPNTLYYEETLDGPARALKAPDLLPAAWTQVPAQVIQWKSDGFTVEGLLSLPPQSHGHKVPLVVLVHGGPTGAWLDNYDTLTEFLLAQGWAVLRPNPRGSTGYGIAFEAANKNDLGGGDYRDIMAGVDAVIAAYPIDSNRLALMGYSYGGEMAGFVEGKTDRFKAIVSGAPVIDQESEYGTEDCSWYDRWFYGKPWEHPEDAWRQSPLAGAAHAKTPFLLLQGEDDSVDPLGQSLEMYRALRQEGVQVEMVQYPRVNHGPLAGALRGNPSPEPWHGFDARQRVVKFIQTAFDKAGAKP